MSGNTIRVGGHDVPFADAEGWVRRYFDADANMTAADPWAYPFYDRMVTGSGPDELNDGDLLAPTLLNAAPRLWGYRTLQRMRPAVQLGLGRVPLDLTLEDAVRRGTHVNLLAGLTGVLDDPGLTKTRAGVRGTMLMKVLHRKRPLFVPLYDARVYACYVGPEEQGYPLQPDAKRPWALFFARLGEAMARDLRTQRELWGALGEAAPQDVAPLRLLDVVAWNVGKNG